MQMTKKSLTSLLASALLLAAPASLRAQEQAWTMDSCMHYAVLHASGVQRQRIATRQREQDYRKAVAGFLPSLGAELSAQYQWGRNVDPETGLPQSMPSARRGLPSFSRRQPGRRWPTR